MLIIILLKAASRLFGLIVKRRNIYFDKKDSKVKLGIPVFSIGNLSAGGSGKTPFCIHFVKILLELDKKPSVVGRTYKAKAKDEIIVSDGRNIFSTPDYCGDELYLIASKVNVPVVGGKEKNKAAQIVLDRFNIDCVVVDDGFQHRQLKRDLDIILLDKDTILNPKLIPVGRLREPLSSLERAQIICLPENLQLTSAIKNYINSDAIVIKFSIKMDRPYSLYTGSGITEEEERQMKLGALAVSGIAKPFKFEELLLSEHVNIKDTVHFSDHHNYDWKDLDKILAKCSLSGTKYIAITEKDGVKLKKFSKELKKRELLIFVIPIRLEIIDGEKQFISKVKEIFNKYRI